jgi:hypothetical protein
MNLSVEAKLHQLRDKTNRELASLIGNKLHRGLVFARLSESQEAQQDWASTEQFHVKAECALAEVSALMLLLAGETSLEHRRLEFQLAELRDALNRGAETQVRARAAC